MCMNMSTSFKGVLPLSNLLEIHVQKGSIICISLRVSFQSSLRGGGVFTLFVVDVVLGSVGGVVSGGLCVLLQVWVAGPSEVDVTKRLTDAVGVVGVPLTFTGHERQSATLLQAPDIHSYVISSMFWRPSVYFVVTIFTI